MLPYQHLGRLSHAKMNTPKVGCCHFKPVFDNSTAPGVVPPAPHGLERQPCECWPKDGNICYQVIIEKGAAEYSRVGVPNMRGGSPIAKWWKKVEQLLSYNNRDTLDICIEIHLRGSA